MRKNKIQITNNRNVLYLLFTLLYFTNLSFGQFDIPPKPSLQTSVYDYANMLSSNEKNSLEEKLIKYSDSTSTQIVAITIESLKGENIGLLAPKWGQEWGIGGSKEQDNGIIILLAKAERKIWISPGYGVEDKLTAGIVGEITRKIIVPEFKAGSYYNGLDKGTDAIFEVLKGKYKGTRKSDEMPLGTILFFIFIFIVLFILISKNRPNGNNKGGGSGGFDLSDIIILSSMGRGGSGWSSGGSSWGGGSSGGFGGGFGGGGFSGGGAGGDW
ncbi:MAG: TPM domain-containing protein [Limnohabitans sp.]|nr:TPM domain-containing protein [Limnohabitans sp.]